MRRTVDLPVSAHIEIDAGAVAHGSLAGRAFVLDGKRARRCPAVLRADGIDLPDLPAGTHTLWIDVPGFAPFMLRDARLDPGENHLGRIRLDPGSSLRVVSSARICVYAWSLRAPSYVRVSDRAPVVHGLGPGPHRVVAGIETGGFAWLDRIIDVHGDDEFTIDLRDPGPRWYLDRDRRAAAGA